MKKISNLFLVTIVLVSISFLGCKKQAVINIDNDNNFNYEKLGQEHNKFLKLYFEQKGQKKDLNFKEFYEETIRPKLSADLNINIDESPSYEELLNMLSQDNLNFSDLGNLDKVMKNIKINNNWDKNELRELGNIIKKYGYTSDFKEKIDEFEAKIKTNNKVNKKLLLSSSSIAKYSDKFWSKNLKTKNPVTDIILADALGYGIGYTITRNWMGGLFLAIVASGEYEKQKQ